MNILVWFCSIVSLVSGLIAIFTFIEAKIKHSPKLIAAIFGIITVVMFISAIILANIPNSPENVTRKSTPQNNTTPTIGVTTMPINTPTPTPTDTSAITPSPTSPTTFNPTNVSLPFTFQISSCTYCKFKLVLVNITPNSEQGSDWNFMITNNGVSACNSTTITHSYLTDQDNVNHGGTDSTPFNIGAGKTIKEVVVFPVAPSNGFYTYTPDIYSYSNCSNGYLDSFLSQTFDF